MTCPSDPVMLLSYINTQLRDHYESLAALCGPGPERGRAEGNAGRHRL